MANGTKFVVRLGNRYLNQGRLVGSLKAAEVFDGDKDGIVLECASRLSLTCVRIERRETVIVDVRAIDDEQTDMQRKIKYARESLQHARTESEFAAIVRSLQYNNDDD